MKRLLLVMACLLALAGTAGAITYDLKTDFSYTANPNGLWSYNKGLSPLLYQADFDPSHTYATGQQAWAETPVPSQGHVPFWLQASKDDLWGPTDLKQGDITMHPSSGGSTLPPYAEGNVTWKSNINGVVNISGNVWFGNLYSDRSVDWYLYLNGTQLTMGTVYYGDIYSRDNPLTFGVFTENVNVNDVIMFQAVGSPGKLPESIGVNLTIDATPVPLPPGLLLLGSGLLTLGGYSLRRRRS